MARKLLILASREPIPDRLLGGRVPLESQTASRCTCVDVNLWVQTGRRSVPTAEIHSRVLLNHLVGR